ncbi:hypothetical protein Leryth_010790 [Lithospermum erythrorhizon]|nr:hypothetical protein Leryth_010790 [Lithospermum erythrorhizon]
MLHSAPQMSYQQQPQVNTHQPYVVYSPVNKTTIPGSNMLNSWSNKAETTARNIWHNLRAGPSVTESAFGKLNLTAKALAEGGFDSLYRHHFGTQVNEKLMKTYACSISTPTGPVAGTLYLSTHRVGFCSDRPSSFRSPSGLETWSYYKVSIPLANIGNVIVIPSVLKRTIPEKHIQITTIDGHEFWFMGFVKLEKAFHNLLASLSEFKAYQNNPLYIANNRNNY